MTKKIIGTTNKPRVSIFRSNRFISGQIIDDSKSITILSDTSKKIAAKMTSVEKARETGKSLGNAAKTKKITEVVFDRNGYRYHGQVKAFAEGMRESGIKF